MITFKLATPLCLANQKLCYFQIILHIEKPGEQDHKEHSKESQVNTEPGKN